MKINLYLELSMAKLLCSLLLCLLFVFTANAMQDTKTKQFTTFKTTISIDWLIIELGAILLGVKRRKIKRKRQSKVGKWLRVCLETPI